MHSETAAAIDMTVEGRTHIAGWHQTIAKEMGHVIVNTTDV